MAADLTISNASPLIALQQIGQFDLLSRIFGTVLIPPAVESEIKPDIPVLPEWLKVQPLAQPIPTQILQATLGRGESEAISLALELNVARVLIDERSARRMCATLRISPLGTLGLLLVAKQNGLIPAVRPLLEELARHRFRVADELLALVLRDAGESP